MSKIEIECELHREENEVSFTVHRIPLEQLQKVLEDIGTEEWRTNMTDGINGKLVSPEVPVMQRDFRVDQ